MKLQKANRTATLFSLTFGALTISGILTGLFLGNLTIDIQLHDSYFVLSCFHILMALAIITGFYSSLYYFFPKITGKRISETLGKFHYGLTLFGVFIMSATMLFIRDPGMPKNYFSFDGFGTNNNFSLTNILITVAFCLIIVAQLCFVTNLIYSLIKGPKTI